FRSRRRYPSPINASPIVDDGDQPCRIQRIRTRLHPALFERLLVLVAARRGVIGPGLLQDFLPLNQLVTTRLVFRLPDADLLVIPDGPFVVRDEGSVELLTFQRPA